MKQESKGSGSGFIPGGLSGGFFIYDADEEEKIRFADQNIIALWYI